jgi:hypothetical protein
VTTLLEAANWLRERSVVSDDVRMAIVGTAARHGLTNLSQLADQHPDDLMVLYEALFEMELELPELPIQLTHLDEEAEPDGSDLGGPAVLRGPSDHSGG